MEDRKLVSTISLSRFGIVEEAMCVCLQDFETVDQLIWHCERFETERRRLTDPYSEIYSSDKVAGGEVLYGFPWKNLMTWLSFFKDRP
jgi:uncharacterized protein (UPF0335 family)